MFTRNYYKAIFGAITKKGSSKELFVTTSGSNVKGSYPDEHVMIAYSDYGYSPNMSYPRNSLTNKGGVFFGTGNIPPTFDDYKLAGSLITTFSASASVDVSQDDNGYTITALYTITNTGSEAFTVSEVALMASPSNSALSTKILFERTVLDNPVTIPVGGVGQVTYTIRMNYPT